MLTIIYQEMAENYLLSEVVWMVTVAIYSILKLF